MEKETLAACRRFGKAFFITYRMNDHHKVTDAKFPMHNAIWRNHPGMVARRFGRFTQHGQRKRPAIQLHDP